MALRTYLSGGGGSAAGRGQRMRNRPRRFVVGWAAALGVALVAWLASDRAIAQDTTEEADDEEISAEITVRREFVGEGRTLPGPVVRYRALHVRAGERWKSVLEVASRERPLIESNDGSYRLPDTLRGVARIEDDGDGSPLRLYDHNGSLIQLPDVFDRRVLGEPRSRFGAPRGPERPRHTGRGPEPGAENFQPLVFRKSKADRRRAELRSRYGEAVDRVEGRDRYLRQGNNETEEVLTDPEWEVPVERNVVRDGRLVAHTRIAYAPGRAGTLVPKSVRAERAMADGPFDRTVTTVEYANVSAQGRR